MNDSLTTKELAQPVIVQCIREIGPGGGVSGVAYALQNAWRKSGLNVSSFSLADVDRDTRPRRNLSTIRRKIRLLRDVIVFSVLGTIRSRRLFPRHAVVCHNDTLHGSIYVNHGFHRAMLDSSGKKYRMLLRNPLHIFLWIRETLRFTFDIHDYYVCFSESEQRLLATYYPHLRSKIRIIPNGVDIDRFRQNDSLRAPQREAMAIPEAAFVMIFVGHEYERKGLATIIDSMCHVHDAWLIVVGGTANDISGAASYAARQGVSERVKFLGVVSDVEKVMNAADVLVMPSLFEAWPLVGLEAMACGVPALMTPTGGIPDYLSDGVNGYLIRRDPLDIAAKIAQLRSDPVALGEMRIRCVKVAAQYSWETIASRYLLLLNRDREHTATPAGQSTIEAH